MLPTEELKRDHRVIERMCAVLEQAAVRLDKGEELPADILPRAVDFIRTYADYAHHGKEEETLFPAMARHGFTPEQGPVGVMLEEHEQGRGYVRGMDDAAKQLKSGDRSAGQRAARNARGYAMLLPPHIQKEDNILYEMANSALSREEQQELSSKFARIEQERLGPEKRARYDRLVEDLEKAFGIG